MALDPGVLRVLADPTRARIVELLAGEALCTCRLVKGIGAKQANVSSHLKVLREAGLGDTAPCGRFTYYRLRPDALRRAADSLATLADTASTQPFTRRPC